MKILSTLGPKSLNKEVIQKLDNNGVDIFRINLSHIKLKNLKKIIRLIQSYTKKPICIDTEGAQIRTGDLGNRSFNLIEQKIYKIFNSNKNKISFYPNKIINQIEMDDIISIDFNSVTVQVINKQKNYIEVKVIAGGKISPNKAVSINRKIKLNPLTKKDIDAIKIAKKLNINYFALSFANNESDVNYFRKIVGANKHVISKIESVSGVKNLEKILKKTDSILIDRGDLSREVIIEKIPFLQKHIIKIANKLNKDVYVATNFLETMIENKNMTRAEANDIYNTLMDGANGLVLAAETAIGENPIKSVKLIKNFIDNFFSLKKQKNKEIDLSLIGHKPYYNKLINLRENIIEKSKKKLKKITLNNYQIIDLENICNGTYSPVNSFMNKKDFLSVIYKYKYKNSIDWPMPIFLNLNKNKINFKIGETIILQNQSKIQIAKLKVKNIEKIDLKKHLKYLSKSNNYIYNIFKISDNYLISGKLNLIYKEGKFPFKNYLTPRQFRYIAYQKGWNNIIAFHTRNLPHKGHLEMQKIVLKQSFMDGLYINPFVYNEKPRDFKTNFIFKIYQNLIKKKYYNNKVILSFFLNYPKFLGPREAIFSAICRQNIGCNYFIIGRDHSGIGKKYDSNILKKLLKKFKNLQINIKHFDEIGFDKKTKRYTFFNKKNKDYYKISGTDIRNLILNKKNIPSFLIEKNTNNLIKKNYNNIKNIIN